MKLLSGIGVGPWLWAFICIFFIMVEKKVSVVVVVVAVVVVVVVEAVVVVVGVVGEVGVVGVVTVSQMRQTYKKGGDKSWCEGG